MVFQNHIDGFLGTYQYVSGKLFRWFLGEAVGLAEIPPYIAPFSSTVARLS